MFLNNNRSEKVRVGHFQIFGLHVTTNTQLEIC